MAARLSPRPVEAPAPRWIKNLQGECFHANRARHGRVRFQTSSQLFRRCLAMRGPGHKFRRGDKTMRKPASLLTTSDLKAEARIWRAEQAEAGHPVTHSQALEMVARFHGFRDWNTASGVLPVTRGPAYSVGQRVEGSYLKQA